MLAAHNIPPAGRRRPFSLVYLLCVCVCVHITVECGWVATRGVGAVKERKRVKEEEATDRPEGDAMRQPPDIYWMRDTLLLVKMKGSHQLLISFLNCKYSSIYLCVLTKCDRGSYFFTGDDAISCVCSHRIGCHSLFPLLLYSFLLLFNVVCITNSLREEE